MNTIPHPEERTPKQRAEDKKSQTRWLRQMSATDTLLLKLGFRKASYADYTYLMPGYPSMHFVLERPLGNIQEVIEWVCAWGYRHGCEAAQKKMRTALDIA